MKELSPERARDIINDWLDRSSNLITLDFNVDTKVKEGIKGASKGYYPIGFKQLRLKNPKLYSILKIKRPKLKEALY